MYGIWNLKRSRHRETGYPLLLGNRVGRVVQNQSAASKSVFCNGEMSSKVHVSTNRLNFKSQGAVDQFFTTGSRECFHV